MFSVNSKDDSGDINSIELSDMLRELGQCSRMEEAFCCEDVDVFFGATNVLLVFAMHSDMSKNRVDPSRFYCNQQGLEGLVNKVFLLVGAK